MTRIGSIDLWQMNSILSLFALETMGVWGTKRVQIHFKRSGKADIRLNNGKMNLFIFKAVNQRHRGNFASILRTVQNY